ncbi:MAG: leucyl aminopeptidase [Legionella sp.]|nr:MAG: leucyl aminopeptidase [Legionella sp.]
MHHGLVSHLEQIKSECLVIGLFSDTPVTELPINASQHALLTHLKSKLIEPGDTIYHAAQDGPALLLIHCGEKKQFTAALLTDYIFKIARMITAQRLTSATMALPQLEHHAPDWQLQQMVIQFEAQSYQFLDLKTKENQPHATKSIEWYLPDTTEEAIHAGQIIAESIRYTRDLANLPANICTPTYLAKQAHHLDTEWDSISVKVMDKQAIEALGMGAFLAVAKGSSEPPQFIQLKYHGAGSEPPIVLIGKGITFDSGGISLKPAEFMEEMKYDMAGAASVLGTLKACASLKLPINVIGLLACTENMPSGSATKPGDVVTSMSGQTIEITNTDAEGRLVLADALTYAKQFNPKYVIDIATLTGAVIIALGSITTGLMSNDDELAEKILTAGTNSQERTWRLPMDNAYQTMLDSPVADMLNSHAGRTAGSITAACFLARFADSFHWAHLDIAGTGWVSGKFRCATGRPVALLVEFLRNMAQKNES